MMTPSQAHAFADPHPQVLKLSQQIRDRESQSWLTEHQAIAQIELWLGQDDVGIDQRADFVDLLGACCGREWLTAATTLLNAGVVFWVDASALNLEDVSQFFCQSVVHEAACTPSTAALELLKSRGADLAVTTGEQSTPLHWAAYFLHPHAIRWLLAEGAPVDAIDQAGQTPLLNLVAYGLVSQDEQEQRRAREGVALLLEAGADPLRADKDGLSAQLAAEQSQKTNPDLRQEVRGMIAAQLLQTDLEQDTATPERNPGRAMPRL